MALGRGHLSLSRSKSETRIKTWKEEEIMLTFWIASLVHGRMYKGRKGEEEVLSTRHSGQKRCLGGDKKKSALRKNDTGPFWAHFTLGRHYL